MDPNVNYLFLSPLECWIRHVHDRLEMDNKLFYDEVKKNEMR